MNMRPRPLWILAMTGVAISLGSCDSPTASAADAAPELITELPRALTQGEIEAVSASNDFSFRLLSEVRGDATSGANVFLSPFSVSVTLGMAANGARDGTLEEIQAALGLEHLTRQEMNEAYQGLHDLLGSLDPRVALTVANSAWLRDGFPFRPGFVERLETYFHADGRPLDVFDPASVDIVNGWVSDRTNGRIVDIVDRIDRDDVLLLINAVHFDGQWRSRFERSQNRHLPFYREDGSTVRRLFMWQEEKEARWGQGEGVVIADLPYGGGAFSMTVVLPMSSSLTELLDELTLERWNRWMMAMDLFGGMGTMPVGLPRFELEWGAALDGVLDRMGMTLAFDRYQADFRDMHTAPEQVYIDRVVHRSLLRVDEEGTEAAGVTVAVAQFLNGVPIEPTPLVVDRPFLVAIRERLSGVILFLGAVYDPEPAG
jgi:serine protease inhibitor